MNPFYDYINPMKGAGKMADLVKNFVKDLEDQASTSEPTNEELFALLKRVAGRAVSGDALGPHRGGGTVSGVQCPRWCFDEGPHDEGFFRCDREVGHSGLHESKAGPIWPDWRSARRYEDEVAAPLNEGEG